MFLEGQKTCAADRNVSSSNKGQSPELLEKNCFGLHGHALDKSGGVNAVHTTLLTVCMIHTFIFMFGLSWKE